MADNDGYYFEKGYLYDEKKVIHALTPHLNIGIFQDSVLFGVAGEDKWGNYACRFFPQWSGIEFYYTLYYQQDYEQPILIHNTGTMKLTIRF